MSDEDEQYQKAMKAFETMEDYAWMDEQRNKQAALEQQRAEKIALARRKIARIIALRLREQVFINYVMEWEF
jgi:hypothetical protein